MIIAVYIDIVVSLELIYEECYSRFYNLPDLHINGWFHWIFYLLTCADFVRMCDHIYCPVLVRWVLFYIFSAGSLLAVSPVWNSVYVFVIQSCLDVCLGLLLGIVISSTYDSTH